MFGRPGVGRRGRRPGLVGTAARGAVVAGTATAVVGGVRRRRARRQNESEEAAAYEAEQQAPQPAPAGPTSDPTAELERLAALKEQGVLTDAEFGAAKAKVLGI